MANRVRLTGKHDGTNDNEAIDAQVDSTFDALHVKSHLYGYDGVGFTDPIKSTAGMIYTADSMLEIARGNVTGMSCVNKFGENPLILAGATEDVWDGGGTYTFETTAAITHIRSAVNSAITRGMTIEVQGLNATWDLVVQTKALDGADSTTEVSLDTPLIRIFRMKVLANAVADQDIWAGSSDFVVAAARAIIQAGNNQTLMAIYTVPNGYTAYMTSYYCDNVPNATRAPDSVEFKLWAADRANSYQFQLKNQRAIPIAGDGFQHEFKPYFKITQKTDIKISATVTGGVGDDSHPHAGFDLILITN